MIATDATIAVAAVKIFLRIRACILINCLDIVTTLNMSSDYSLAPLPTFPELGLPA
jgi:hypothetical protein